jgi:hypothetical protein
MTRENFPNHSGGVVQVLHTARYGAVPEALLEDRRLGLDTRAVAAWLAIKASGWQINVAYLRWSLALPGKTQLGKDLWQRIASELETAGYLSRTKLKGQNGLWVWHITFNPAPANPTMAGSAGYGSAAHGLSGHGNPTDGQAGHIPKQQVTKLFKEKTTTNNAALSKKGNLDPYDQNQIPANGPDLIFPTVSGADCNELKKLISKCTPDARQDVLDEIEGIRQADGIKKGVVPLARALISKSAMGEFFLSAGHKVQEQRVTQRTHKCALEASAKPPQNLSNTSEEAIAQLPVNLQMHMRAARRRTEIDNKD